MLHPHIERPYCSRIAIQHRLIPEISEQYALGEISSLFNLSILRALNSFRLEYNIPRIYETLNSKRPDMWDKEPQITVHGRS